MLMAIALTCFGVVMVYSASSVMAAKRFHDGFYFLKRQGLFALIGFGVMVVAMRVNYHFWKKAAVPILLGCSGASATGPGSRHRRERRRGVALDKASGLFPAAFGGGQDSADHVHGILAR